MNSAVMLGQIGQLQMSKPANSSPKVGANLNSGFGAVFGMVMNSQVNGSMGVSTQPTNKNAQLVDAEHIMNAGSIEELLSIINVRNAEEVISEDDIQNFLNDLLQTSSPLQVGKLAELLQVDEDQMLESLQILLNEEMVSENQPIEDVWQLLSLVEQAAPVFVIELTNSLRGDGKVSATQALQVVKLLKSIELIAPKMDLHMNQEDQVVSLKEVLFSGLKSVQRNVTETTVKPLEFRPVFNRVEVKPVESVEIQSASPERVVLKSETHQITLPTNKASQQEAFTKEFQTIMNRSAFGQVGGATKLLIKIYPEHLGTVRIELTQQNGVMTARLLASTAQGKELLDSQLHHLKQAFVQQNLQVDRVDISQALQDPSRHDKQQSFSEQFRGQKEQSEDHQSQENNDETASFQDILFEMEA